MLTFDEPTHVYRWKGEVVPSVTAIIKPITPDFRIVDPDALERARQEGVAVHKMVELECKHDLDESGLPDWLRPYLAAWRSFVRETRFVMVGSEQQVYSEPLRYAGTLDLHGAFPNHECLIDLKRSFLAGRAIGVQTAAYANALWGKVPRGLHRYGLQLRPNGTYRLREFPDPSDWATFVACLTLHRYNERSDV